jgi:hypothetical protein
MERNTISKSQKLKNSTKDFQKIKRDGYSLAIYPQIL